MDLLPIAAAVNYHKMREVSDKFRKDLQESRIWWLKVRLFLFPSFQNTQYEKRLKIKDQIQNRTISPLFRSQKA